MASPSYPRSPRLLISDINMEHVWRSKLGRGTGLAVPLPFDYLWVIETEETIRWGIRKCRVQGGLIDHRHSAGAADSEPAR